jgi:hypothetical protein
MGMETFVAAGDLHGDRQDERAVSGFKKFVDVFDPVWRIFLGDIFDFRAIREGAKKDEKRHSMEADFQAGMKFLKWYQPNVITLGNHDIRLWDLVEKEGIPKSGPLTDLAKRMIGEFEDFTAKHKTIVLPYDKRKGVWRHNGLKFAHGFGNGKDMVSDMAKVYGNVLHGHGHSIDVASEPSDEEPKVARMVGALCRLDMSYNRSQLSTLRQQHGWAYGVFLPDNKNEVFQARVENGQVVFAGQLRTLKV